MNFVKNSVDFAKNCSVHGVKYIVGASASTLERIFWVLIIVSSLTFSVYLTTLFWCRYTSNLTRTLIESIEAPTTTVPFPAVTICNLNKVLESKLERFIQILEANDDEKTAIRNIISNMMVTEIVTSSLRSQYNATELALATDVLAKNGYDSVKTIIKHVSQTCDALINRCTWNRKQVLCKDIFQDTYTMRGRCCSFNYIKKDSSNSPIYNPHHGLTTGLEVTLLPAFNTRSFAGVTISIHHPRDFPRPYYNLGKMSTLGRVQYIQVQGLKRICSDDVKNLQYVHRQCVFAHEKKLNFFKEYSNSNCLSSCEASLFLNRCHCQPYYHDFAYESADYNRLSTNNTSGMVDCSVQHLPCLESFDEENNESCFCPPQCEDSSYKILSTSSKFVKNSKISSGCLQNDNNTENSITIKVFFSSNQQTVWLRETVTSKIYLISSFGGIYSLFLGCSIITLIEIVYFFIGKGLLQHISPSKRVGEKKDPKGEIFTVKTVTISSKVKWNDYYSYPVVPFVN